jgi:hypothetical protein
MLKIEIVKKYNFVKVIFIKIRIYKNGEMSFFRKLNLTNVIFYNSVENLWENYFCFSILTTYPQFLPLQSMFQVCRHHTKYRRRVANP